MDGPQAHLLWQSKVGAAALPHTQLCIKNDFGAPARSTHLCPGRAAACHLHEGNSHSRSQRVGQQALPHALDELRGGAAVGVDAARRAWHAAHAVQAGGEQLEAQHAQRGLLAVDLRRGEK